MDAMQWNSWGSSKSERAERSASQVMEGSPTAALSNTVCISDPDGSWPTLDQSTMEEFSSYGTVARIDMSLAVVLKCVLVTYFDIRSAQQVLLRLRARAEPFPPAATDCRIVRVKMGSFYEKGFSGYGDVAFVSTIGKDALVEYYDLRSAQMLMADAGGAASPFMMTSHAPQPGPWQSAGIDLAGMSGSSGLEGLTAAATGQLCGVVAPPPGLAGLAAEEHADSGPSTDAIGACSSPTTNVANSSNSDSNTEVPETHWTDATYSNSRFTGTKVSGKEFSKYDIDFDKIKRGEDFRTTCMVRNLVGPRAPDEFHRFLERCSLNNRYTFFYMPCKERRKQHTGFAFINFATPADVYKLCVKVKSGEWRGVVTTSNGRGPEVSYARFQGHEELAEHFSSSAVLFERDPSKRPIFRLEVLEAAKKEMSMMHMQGGAKEEGLPGAAAENWQKSSPPWSAGGQKWSARPKKVVAARTPKVGVEDNSNSNNGQEF